MIVGKGRRPVEAWTLVLKDTALGYAIHLQKPPLGLEVVGSGVADQRADVDPDGYRFRIPAVLPLCVRRQCSTGCASEQRGFAAEPLDSKTAREGRASGWVTV